MLEGLTQTIYGRDAARANRLMTVGGSATIAAAAETALTLTSVNEFGYISYLRADCTVIGTTGGTWRLRTGLAGPTVLYLQMPIVAAPVGTSYCWPFPVPWKTAAQGGIFTLQPSVATMGTWQFMCNGFHSSV